MVLIKRLKGWSSVHLSRRMNRWGGLVFDCVVGWVGREGVVYGRLMGWVGGGGVGVWSDCRMGWWRWSGVWLGGVVYDSVVGR